jgi:hypothetical protein
LCKILIGKPESKTSLERHENIKEYNIKMGLKRKWGLGGVDWI